MDNTLYGKIDTAQKFAAPETGAPVVDQSGHAAFGLAWASRQTERPAQPEVKQMAPIVPVAN